MTLAPAAGLAAHHGKAHAAKDRRALPIVIGHRGAAGYRPEHTLASYRLAIAMGADYIEPDLVSTKDHLLVARHENDITGTTDVADASRVRRPPDDQGDRRRQPITGWFTEDFTLAELQDAARESSASRTCGRPTRRSTASSRSRRCRRSSTSPSASGRRDLPRDQAPDVLRLDRPLARGAAGRGAEAQRPGPPQRQGVHPVLRDRQPAGARPETDVPLVQLIDATGAPVRPRRRGRPAHLRRPGDAGGAARRSRRTPTGSAPTRTGSSRSTRPAAVAAPTTLIPDAHRAGLLVHPFTFRPENNFLAADFRLGNPASPEFLRARGDQPAELALFYRSASTACSPTTRTRRWPCARRPSVTRRAITDAGPRR